jgi:DNA-binding transcriptional ArsR family regulator
LEDDLETKLRSYRAVTNKTRLTILLDISKKKDGASFGELRERLRLNSNALDFHLGKLTEAKLVVNVPKTPMTKRAQAEQMSEVAPLSLTVQKKSTLGDTHYSYYKITENGKAILANLDIKSDARKSCQ